MGSQGREGSRLTRTAAGTDEKGGMLNSNYSKMTRGRRGSKGGLVMRRGAPT